MNLGDGDSVVAVATTNGKKLDEPNGGGNMTEEAANGNDEEETISDENGVEEV